MASKSSGDAVRAVLSTAVRNGARNARQRGITALLLGRRGLSSSTAATRSPRSYNATARVLSGKEWRRIRCYATTTTANHPPQRSIAVLGGGLTGLTTAYYLTRYAPHAKITIYEASDRLGGWIDTEEVAVKTPEGKEGKVLFERGARTIASQNGQPKFDDLVFHDLVTHLGLKSELRSTDKKRDRVRRFIYYPDHLVDVTGPVLSPLTKPLATITSLVQFAVSLFREPLFRGALPSVLHMQQKGHELVRQKSDRDLSIGDFFHTLFGRRELVDNVMSGMMHGIYGGDVWKLSTESSGMFSYNLDVLRTNLPGKSDRRPGEILIKLEDWELLWDMASRDAEVFQTAREAMGAGYVWFSGGFQTLTDGLVNNLKRNPNVTIKTGTPVRSVGYDHDSARVLITSESDRGPMEYDKAVSTLVARTLAGLTDGKLPTLAQEQAVTIMVVNLWYPVPNLNSPYHGFGYLMPQSLGFENNPECALGVLFDSDRDAIIGDAGDTAPGTKFTVMLGGHLWSDLPPEWLPSSEDAIRMAKSAVSRHLNIPEEVSDQAVGSTKLCRECIPQQLTGHRQRMAAAHQELLRGFQGRLAVAGTSYQPPGVLTSLRAGRDVAWQISGGWRRGSSSPGLVEEEGAVGAVGARESESARPTRLLEGAQMVELWMKERDKTGEDRGERVTSVGDTGLMRFLRGSKPPRWVVHKRQKLPLRYGSLAVFEQRGDRVKICSPPEPRR